MKYVIYDKETKIINKITIDEPVEVLETELVAKTDNLNLGDEISQQIIIHEIKEDEFIKSYSAYKVAPNVGELLNELRKKDIRINTLENQLSLAQQAIDEMIFNNGGAL